MHQLKENFLKVKNRISQAQQEYKQEKSVELLAVSKTHSLEKIQALAELGQKKFGESYLQEALPKVAALPDLEWHYIGPIQSNKTRSIAESFDWVQSVDRLRIAERLNAQRPAGRGVLNILLQVNISQEESKSGFALEEILQVAQAIQTMPNLKLRGLMCIPAPSESFAEQIKPFAQVFEVFAELQALYPGVDTLSMGMSADLEAAISQGSSCVRIGTDIFGARS